MTNEQLWEQIDSAVTAVCRASPIGDEFSNNIAKVFFAGDLCARANDCDWVDGEGYPKAYWDWNIKGMQNQLKYEHYPRNVHEFFAKFF